MTSVREVYVLITHDCYGDECINNVAEVYDTEEEARENIRKGEDFTLVKGVIIDEYDWWKARRKGTNSSPGL